MFTRAGNQPRMDITSEQRLDQSWRSPEPLHIHRAHSVEFSTLAAALQYDLNCQLSVGYRCRFCGEDSTVLGLCDHCAELDKDVSSASESEYSDCDFLCDSDTDTEELHSSDTIPDGYYLFHTDTLVNFVQQVNSTSRCSTQDCSGQLRLTSVHSSGMGAGMLVAQFNCDGCVQRQVELSTKLPVAGSRRNATSLTTSLAFLCTGNTPSAMNKILGKYLFV